MNELMNIQLRRAVIEDNLHRCVRAVSENAIEVGRWLNAAKEEGIVEHGHWSDWVQEHTTLSARSAQRLMAAAREIAPGSPLEHLPLASITALIALPEGERETLAESIDAGNRSTREVQQAVAEYKRQLEEARQHEAAAVEEARERAIAEARRAGQSALARQNERIDGLQRDLNLQVQQTNRYRHEAECARNALAGTEKRLEAAQDEADQLAEKLDEMQRANHAAKLGSEGSDICARILSAIGGMIAMCGRDPERIRQNPGLVSGEDWNLLAGKIQIVRAWCDQMYEAMGVDV